MTDPDSTRTGKSPLGALDVMLGLVVLLVAVAGYVLLRRVDATAPLIVERPVAGALVYAGACVVILLLLLRWGHRHIKVVRTLGPAGPLAVFSAAMPALCGFLLLGSLGVVGPWLREMGLAGVALYAAAFAILAGCALLPTYAQAILGGVAFGFATGFPAAMVGFTGASIIGYVIGASASGDRIIELIRAKPKWEAVRVALAGGGFWKTLGLVTLLRLPPNSPFALTNLVMSSVRIPILPYVLGSIFGLAPRTGVAVWAAAAIRDEITGEAPDRPRWMTFAGIGLTIAIVLIIGSIANRAIERVTQSESAPDPAK